jgi:hypothetical protein
MPWTVLFHPRVAKDVPRLPTLVQDVLRLLLAELEGKGPVRGNWPNYGKLSHTRHHCHLKKGRPTSVAAWEERDRRQRLIEVIYVGTHEKAPY